MKQAFINSIAEEIEIACKGTGLFTSVMLAQACLESAYGTSVLSAKHFNFFGMKPGSKWNGPVVNMPTQEFVKGHMITVTQPFRTYPDLKSCFEDHVKMLQTVSVYTTARLLKCKTADDQCKALLKAGYATDPGYANKLIAIIKENDLTQYDGTQS